MKIKSLSCFQLAKMGVASLLTTSIRIWAYKHPHVNNALACVCSFRFLPVVILFLLCLTFWGAFTNLVAKSHTVENFHYPVEGNIQLFISQLKAGQKPLVEPINVFNYTYLKPCHHKCSQNKSPIILIVIKSALANFHRRQTIRETWGREDKDILTVFLLGTDSDHRFESDVDVEDRKYGDIVQSDFIDFYYNNTLKTMSGFKWVINACPHAHYIFFADDDMYVSVRNLLRFLENPANYASAPNFNHSRILTEDVTNNEVTESTSLSRLKQKLRDKSSKESLYAGYVFHSAPIRLLGSKWYVSLQEYPYNMWPPYVTAGAYVLSRKALTELYYVMLYTKRFRFDDVFLGLVAWKANIELLHCPHVYFAKKHYSLEGYRDVVASHGYGDPSELKSVWIEQKNAGQA